MAKIKQSKITPKNGWFYGKDGSVKTVKNVNPNPKTHCGTLPSNVGFPKMK